MLQISKLTTALLRLGVKFIMFSVYNLPVVFFILNFQIPLYILLYL